MKSAPVQNPSSLATLPSSFFSLLNKGVAVYPNTERSEVEGSHTCISCSIFGVLLIMFLYPAILSGQVDSINQSSKKDTIVEGIDHAVVQANAYPSEWKQHYLTKEQKTIRRLLIGGLNVVGYGISIVIFNNQWYKDYPKTTFHTFNDSREWLQMDKLGHVWAAYNSGRASAAMWRWAGVEPKKATWIGGLSSSVYLTVIEILDAHSAKWGWSWADMGANVFGSGLFISQQLGWREQRIHFKFSFHHKNYAEPILNERADDLFGKAWTERMLKDYNGQTYWLSANLKSFFPKSNLPAWLNIAVGYGAEGMFGGFENKWDNGDPGFPIDRSDIKRYRQWYLAPDISFSNIKTNKKAVKILLAALDAFKFPAPSLELSNGKIKVNAIHF